MKKIEISFKEVLRGSVKTPLDCALLLDKSGSMAATDFPPNRWAAACKSASYFTMKKIMKGHQDRVALVTFGGEPEIVRPLTSDLRDIEHALESLNGLTLTGTGIGPALQAAAKLLQAGGAERKRAVILLSDGESNVGPEPVAIAKSLQGIRVFTIGVGSMKGQDLDLPGLGRVRVHLDEQALRNIARATGGRYYYAPSAGELLDIFAELSDE